MSSSSNNNNNLAEQLTSLQEKYAQGIKTLNEEHKHRIDELSKQLDEKLTMLKDQQEATQARETKFDERIAIFTKQAQDGVAKMAAASSSSSSSALVSSLVKLNIGGTKYVTKVDTILKGEPESIFTPLLSGNFQIEKDHEDYIYFDRSGTVFDYLMEYLRTGSIRLIENYKLKKKQQANTGFSSLSSAVVSIESIAIMERIEEEAQFFGFENLLGAYFSNKVGTGISGYTFIHGATSITKTSASWETFNVSPVITQLPARIVFKIANVNAQDTNTWKFIIGVELSATTLTNGGQWLGCDTSGYGYSAKGCFVHNSGSDTNTYGHPYGQNDKIEVRVSADYALSFLLNGVDLGVAANLPAKQQYAFAVSMSHTHTIEILQDE